MEATLGILVASGRHVAGFDTNLTDDPLGANSLDGQVQVLEGLQAADIVVAYSQRELTAGARVQVVDALVKPVAKVSTP